MKTDADRVTQNSGIPSSSRNASLSYLQRPTEDRILSGTPPVYHQPSTSSQRFASYGGFPQTQRVARPEAGERSGGGSSSSAAPRSFNRRLPPLPAPAPQPQIAEEDECPVCHRELPPRTLANFEALREAHITICITAHSTYGGAVPSSSTGDGGGGSGNSGDGTGGAPLPPMPPRRTGMFPYVATEKDCVDSAECTICLEEFEVGVPMARLECLCRFHRTCIAAWWERHPGRCPMHQHDSFGY